MLDKIFGGSSEIKLRNEQDVKTVLEVLTTSIEAINQRLAGSHLDDTFNNSLKEFIPRFNNALKVIELNHKKLSEEMTSMDDRLQKIEQNIDTRMAQLIKAVLYQNKLVKETSEDITQTQKSTGDNIVQTNKKFTQKLEEMIKINLEEVQILRTQNETFIRKMESIEKEIEDMLRKR